MGESEKTKQNQGRLHLFLLPHYWGLGDLP